MARLTLTYWRDIPIRLTYSQGRRREHLSLGERFATAMERAGLREGKGQSHALLDDWRREQSDCVGDAASVLQAARTRIDSEYDEQRLKDLERACGWASRGGADRDVSA